MAGHSIALPLCTCLFSWALVIMIAWVFPWTVSPPTAAPFYVYFLGFLSAGFKAFLLFAEFATGFPFLPAYGFLLFYFCPLWLAS